MSSYGPSGGSYSQPQEPWHDRPPQDYGQPTDPWGGQPLSAPPPQAPYSPAPQYGAPAPYDPQFDPQYGSPPPTGPVWQTEPPQPDGPRRTALIVTVIAVVGILLVGGAVATYIALDRNTPGGGGATSGPPSTPATAESNTADVRFATKGQCVVNEGSNDEPVMKVVPCAKNTYEILARFDGQVDPSKPEKKCETVEGYEYHYYYDSSLDTLDFVLCMKKRA